MPLDDPNSQGIHFIGYDVNGTESFNVGLSDPDSFITKDDFEGLTYLEEDYFVLVEEKESKIYFLEYIIPSSGNPYFVVLSGHNTNIRQSMADDKDGLEGISYNPHTNRLFVIREKANIELFSIPITLPNADFKGDINEAQKSSVIIPIQGDGAGLFHLAKIFPSSNEKSNNILIVNEANMEIWEFKLILDSNGNLFSASLSDGNKTEIPNEPQPEGIVVYDNTIYIASEKAGGGLSSYKINPGLEVCNTDCSEGVVEVRNAITCECEPAPNTGCTDSNACNYDKFATIDDCSCVYKNSRCDDGDNGTINDIIREDCICRGIPACQCQDANKTE